MKHHTLIIVTSNPAADQAVEALRIAAGIGAWQKVEVTVCLRGHATTLVAPNTLSTHRDVATYIDQITRTGRPILLEFEDPLEQTATEGAHHRQVDRIELAQLASQSDSVLVY